MSISSPWLVVVLTLVASACGNGSTAPSPPAVTPAVPTLTSVAIAGPAAVKIGPFVQYTAAATLSDGSSQTVTSSVAWSSSNTSVANINSSGQLVTLTHGSTVLTAAYQGRTGSKAVNIVNDYGGGWTGSYTATACDASGAFASVNWCRGVVGAPVSFSVEITQTGSDMSQVSGTFPILVIRNVPVTGIVTSDGRLILGADTTGSSNGLTFRFQVGGWETRLTPPTPPRVAPEMAGRMAFSLSGLGLSGNAYEELNITFATRTHPQPTVGVAER